ncbi:hypothetical protein KC343_g838 [Hortaea werneckii]|nr:hypothetical protein KC352_g18581 [Hortaea werneckii]KAI7571911.1 hypothetical protein KC317_g1224 [Hortaea werneckii]KAI7626752.1 hypothetical protein KC346_g1101 [Hortaea werneckii]KAI7637207.1 hypothetical protein KC343_g838 [Hortaea werneckii]KAI7678454.1 hypothetical protein KC319_g3334 [Hortaea werneckii]
MLEFPSSRANWSLDVVSILAILGENNIAMNAPIITLSWTCLLPRLLPAPQGLLTNRWKSLPYEEDVVVVRALGGNTRKGLDYRPNVLHGAGDRTPYRVKEIRISYKEDTVPALFCRRAWKEDADAEALATPLPNPLRLKPFGPLNLIAIVSSVTTFGLFVWAICIRDGMATIGILLMSLAAPLLGLNGRWRFMSQPRIRLGDGSPGDVIIRNRYGSFMVVHCEETISRALYFGPSDIDYHLESYVGVLSSSVVGGLVLSVAIVFFGNSSWTMQAALTITYGALNAFYWIATGLAAKNQKVHWDCSSLEIVELSRAECVNWTEALWNAIRFSKTTHWVREGGAMPNTETWRAWLAQAEHHLEDDNWDAKQAWNEIHAQHHPTT